MERQRHAPTRPVVLVADGHADTVELYATSLSTWGCETTTVTDDAQAFALAQHLHPDIIVTELSAPGFDGWQFIRDLKRDPHTRDIPVVVVTGDAQIGARERADRVGCSAFLIKPCLPEDLALTLRLVLHHPRPNDQAAQRRA